MDEKTEKLTERQRLTDIREREEQKVIFSVIIEE